MKKKENKKGVWVECHWPKSIHWRDPSGFECTLGDIVVSPNGYESVVVKSDDDDVWGLLGSTDSFCALKSCNLTGYKKIRNINQTTDKKMSKLFELEEQAKYDGTMWYLKIDGAYIKAFMTYEEAWAEYEHAIHFTPTKIILRSKEVTL